MSSQIPFYDSNYDSIKNRIEANNSTPDKNYIKSQRDTNVVFRTALEKTTNLGKRSCNEYKYIFDDLKYKNYNKTKINQNNTILNINENRNLVKKEENRKIRSVFSAKSKDRFTKK